MKKILFAAIAALAGYGLSGCATYGHYGYGYDYGYYRDGTCPEGMYRSGPGRCSRYDTGYRRSYRYYDPGVSIYFRDRFDDDDRPYRWSDSFVDYDRYEDDDWYDQRRAGRRDRSNYNPNDRRDRQYRETERREARRGGDEVRSVGRHERRRDRDRN